MTAGAPRIFAIVPAAGRSRRMGRAKQLLDIDGRPMLLAVLEPLAAAAVDGIALVTHNAIARRIDYTHLPGVILVPNEDETTEMIDSVRLALDAWHALETISPTDGFLVCPADHPGVKTADFDACIATYRRSLNHLIIATHAGRRGHPLIFPAALAAFVHSHACDTGLNALPRKYADDIIVIERPSTAVARDIDTPADYENHQ